MPSYIDRHGQKVWTGKWHNNLRMGFGSGYALFGSSYILNEFYNDINLISQNNLSLEDILWLIPGIAITSIGVLLFNKGYKERNRIKRLENLVGRKLDSSDYQKMYWHD